MLLDQSPTSSRNGDAREMIGFQGIITDPKTNFLLNSRRRLSPHYAAAELLWYLNWTDDATMIIHYAPQYEKFTENGRAYGAYGSRIALPTQGNQLSHVIGILRHSPDSRQAVVSLWDRSDVYVANNRLSKDIPCTLSLQFLVRDNRLHMITTMRSQDIWLGMPYDVFCFTCLQMIVADALNIEVGVYVHQCGSVHLYEKNYEAAFEAVEDSSFFMYGHDWATAPVEDIPGACLAEWQSRNGHIRDVHGLSDMFNDLVVCCELFNGYDLADELHSPALRKAVELCS